MEGNNQLMIRLTCTTSLALALLVSGSLSRIEASGDTPITVKDGGSIVLIADGLDAAVKWQIGGAELRHRIPGGVLTGVKITEEGADRCSGDAMCGIDPTQPWSIRVIYNARIVTIASLSGNKGLHVKFSPKILFTQWKKTGVVDQRVFGHGDGRYISSIKVNGGTISRCAGKGGCEVTVTYTTP
jgi:hypothetical protein